MGRQSGRHRRSPNPPLETLPWLGGDPEAVVLPTEVVGTAHQVHPPGQDPFAPDQRPAAAHQRAQRSAERRVEPLEVSVAAMAAAVPSPTRRVTLTRRRPEWCLMI